MKNTQTEVFERNGFKSFREELLARTNKTDIVASSQSMFMDTDGVFHIESDGGPDVTGTPTNWAHSQLATYTDIPLKYYKKMNGQLKDKKGNPIPAVKHLLAANVNHWLTAENKNRLIRMYNGEIIAFLSDRFNRIDNYEVATVAMQAAHDVSPTVQMFRSHVTESRMGLTMWDPETVIELPSDHNDVYYPALHITNSEVGDGTYNVVGELIRGACSNGLILYHGKDYSRRHIGGRLSEGVDDRVWSRETQKILSELIKSQTRDVATSAFDQVDIMYEIAKLDKLKGEPMKATFMDATPSVLGLSEKDNEAIWDRIEGNNRYEFLQAVTNRANDYFKRDSDPEKGVELQQLGGRLLNDPSIWNEIEREHERLNKNKGTTTE